jgi:hypothetical protein
MGGTLSSSHVLAIARKRQKTKGIGDYMLRSEPEIMGIAQKVLDHAKERWAANDTASLYALVIALVGDCASFAITIQSHEVELQLLRDRLNVEESAQ